MPPHKGINEMKDITTTNLADFGAREWNIVQHLVNAKQNFGFPEDFNTDEVTIMFNKNSGYVFFTNSDYQVAIVDDNGKLYSFYYCSNCGHEGCEEEGFEKDENRQLCDECFEKENQGVVV